MTDKKENRYGVFILLGWNGSYIFESVDCLMTRRHNPKRRFRFTFAALLFVMLWIAGILSGYRVGFHRGYVGGERKRQSERLFSKVYPVGDLVMPLDGPPLATPDYEPLIFAIENVSAHSWDNVGGSGSMVAMPVNQTLVIKQTEDVHEQIDTLLQEMRQAAAAIQDARKPRR